MTARGQGEVIHLCIHMLKRCSFPVREGEGAGMFRAGFSGVLGLEGGMGEGSRTLSCAVRAC